VGLGLARHGRCWVMVFLAVLAIVALVAFLMRLVVRAAPPVARTCAIHPHLRSFEYANGWMSGAYRGLAMRFHAFEGLYSDDHWTPPGLTIRIVLNRPHFVHIARREREETSAVQDPRLGAPLLHGPYRTASPPSPDSGDRQVDAHWSVEGAPAGDVDTLLADPSMQSALLSFYQLDGLYMTLKERVLVLHLVGADRGDAGFLTAGLDSAVRFVGVLGSRLPGFLTRDGANELDELDAHRAEEILLGGYRFHTILLTIAPALLVFARTVGRLEGAPVGCLLITNAISTAFVLSAIKERRKCGRPNSIVSVRLLRFVKVSWIAFALVIASDLLANGCGS
jgi:hypothetical protein